MKAEAVEEIVERSSSNEEKSPGEKTNQASARRDPRYAENRPASKTKRSRAAVRIR